jgi:predicted lipoprotein with Yx(FWY)xxD motif
MVRWLRWRAEAPQRGAALPTGITIACTAAIVLSAFAVVGAPASAAVRDASAPKVTLKTKKVSGVGTVLVDPKGKTLYTLTAAGQPVACTGGCTAIWPPLTAPAGATFKGPKGITLGFAPDGMQLTAGGLPLYRFSGDSKAGQANGEGISSFGGTWHVVTTAGTASSKGTKPSSSGGSGSGY